MKCPTTTPLLRKGYPGRVYILRDIQALIAQVCGWKPGRGK